METRNSIKKSLDIIITFHRKIIITIWVQVDF